MEQQRIWYSQLFQSLIKIDPKSNKKFENLIFASQQIILTELQTEVQTNPIHVMCIWGVTVFELDSHSDHNKRPD